MNHNNDIFLQLVRLGVGIADNIHLPEGINWHELEVIAIRQGLLSVMVDGIEKLPENIRPPKNILLQWVGSVIQDENRFSVQQKASIEMASLFNSNYIRTYVLKGAVIAECYPKPEHRASVDMDCFLLPEYRSINAWSLGNDLIRSQGYEVCYDYYKNSTFYLSGLTVENHLFMIPFRGNKVLQNLEFLLQRKLREDRGDNRFEGTWLYRPPVMLTSLFLIEHAYSHFLHEGLTWRHILDWMMFKKKHIEEIDWDYLEARIDEFGFRKFYDSYYRLGQYLVGDVQEIDLTKLDKRMLADVWADLDLIVNDNGIKSKFASVGSTMRARWKYHDFADISVLRALWIQAKGVLFIKIPSLK